MIITMPHIHRDRFEATALPHMGALHGMALKLTRRPQSAEDLVQDTLLRAYRAFDTFEEGTNARAWLFQILRNVHINHYRAAKLRPEDADFTVVEGFVESSAETPEDAVMKNVLDSEVQAAMDALSEEFREIVELALLDDLSYKEIAERLDIPVGTVMSRLHRGRKILQMRLGGYARRHGIIARRKAA